MRCAHTLPVRRRPGCLPRRARLPAAAIVHGITRARDDDDDDYIVIVCWFTVRCHSRGLLSGHPPAPSSSVIRLRQTPPPRSNGHLSSSASAENLSRGHRVYVRVVRIAFVCHSPLPRTHHPTPYVHDVDWCRCAHVRF